MSIDTGPLMGDPLLSSDREKSFPLRLAPISCLPMSLSQKQGNGPAKCGRQRDTGINDR